MKLKEIINYLEKLANPQLQENYDNCGLITGSYLMEISSAIVCLDATERVIDEAIKKGANLVIAHHPIVFKGLKSFTGKNYVERTILKAIKNDIAIYAIHTNLDNVLEGVNNIILNKLGATGLKILSPKNNTLLKLQTFVPINSAEKVRNALFSAGAGNIGNYSEASFNTSGIGTFKGNEFSNPKIGTQNVREDVEEVKIETIFPFYLQSKILESLFEAHPYEEVAYDIIKLENTNQETGAGMIGVLENPMPVKDFLNLVKQQFHCKAIKHTALVRENISTIAVCGGSGSFLLKDAIKHNADIFITADFKYHDFFDADNQIIITDIGHYESEQYTMQLLLEKMNKIFPNFAIFLTEVNTNPVQYYL